MSLASLRAKICAEMLRTWIATNGRAFLTTLSPRATGSLGRKPWSRCDLSRPGDVGLPRFWYRGSRAWGPRALPNFGLRGRYNFTFRWADYLTNFPLFGSVRRQGEGGTEQKDWSPPSLLSAASALDGEPNQCSFPEAGYTIPGVNSSLARPQVYLPPPECGEHRRKHRDGYLSPATRPSLQGCLRQS